jgi:Family of unknown function (DUF5985)
VDVIDGATAMACCAIALFFLRFWRQTHDRLFAFFALAFAVFAANRIVLTAIAEDSESRTIVYAVRFLAFALIAYAVIDKNRADARR